jgi:transcriptional regulator with XRE-family HTH domain
MHLNLQSIHHLLLKTEGYTMTFGDKITLMRKQKKLSQAELGKFAGINGDIVGKYERDKMKPSIETAKKLADALDVSLDYLVGDGDMKALDKKQ